MPAGKVPPGVSVPQAPKPEAKAAIEAEAPKDVKLERPLEASTKAEETPLDDEDLQNLSESRKIPYSRFKEVNDAKKSLEGQLATLRQELDSAKSTQYSNKKTQDEASDDLSFVYDDSTSEVKKLKEVVMKTQAEINALRSEARDAKLKSDIDKLQERYPEADRVAVLGWAKVTPNSDISDLMEFSHNRNLERTESAIQKLIEKKKERSKSKLVTDGAGIRLTEVEKPKTLQEAHKVLRRFFSSDR